MEPIIRLATLDDAEAIREIYAPFCEATPVSFETQAPSVDEMRRRIAKTLESLPWLVREHHGEIVGYAYASPHRERAAYRWSVDVSAYVRDGYRRTGVGRALVHVTVRALAAARFLHALSPASRCPTPAAWASTNRWDFNRSASTGTSASSAERGMMWHGTSSPCANRPTSRTIPSIWRSCAACPSGPPRSRVGVMSNEVLYPIM